MKLMRAALFMVLVLSLLVIDAGAKSKAKVLADRVNLRAGPGLKWETVGQAAVDDVLLVVKIEKEWMKIVPPDDVDMWIYGDLVKQGVVQGASVNIRAGAGINYTVVGKLNKDDDVEVREAKGEWLRVAPPKGSYLWISRSLVDLDGPPKKIKPVRVPVTPLIPVKTTVIEEPVKWAEPVEPKVAKPVPIEPIKQAKPVETAAVRPPPLPSDEPMPVKTNVSGTSDESKKTGVEGLTIDTSHEQGRTVTYKGALKKASFVWRRPSKLCLVRYDEGKAATVCYVKGNPETLKPLVGRSMTVHGKEYWVKGVRYPVVVPVRVVVAAQSDGGR